MREQLREIPRRDAADPLPISLHPHEHLAVIRFAPADTLGVCATDAEYRAITGKFFRQHRNTAHVALLNLSPFIRVVAEMFRVAIRLQLRTFEDEAAARSWLRTKGVAA